jgi:hypothetical protein
MAVQRVLEFLVLLCQREWNERFDVMHIFENRFMLRTLSDVFFFQETSLLWLVHWFIKLWLLVVLLTLK